MADFDWSRFTVRINVKASVENYIGAGQQKKELGFGF
jgi:hypothetical protein